MACGRVCNDEKKKDYSNSIIIYSTSSSTSRHIFEFFQLRITYYQISSDNFISKFRYRKFDNRWPTAMQYSLEHCGMYTYRMNSKKNHRPKIRRCLMRVIPKC